MQSNKLNKLEHESENTLQQINTAASENNYNQALELISAHINENLNDKSQIIEEKDKIILGNEFQIQQLKYKIHSLQTQLNQRRNVELENLNLRHEITVLEDEIRKINHEKNQQKIVIQSLKASLEKIQKQKQFIIEKLQITAKQLNARTVKYIDEDQTELNNLYEKVEQLNTQNYPRIHSQVLHTQSNQVYNKNPSSYLGTYGYSNSNSSTLSNNSNNQEEIYKTLDQVLLRIQTTSPFSEKYAGNLDILLDIYQQSKFIIEQCERQGIQATPLSNNGMTSAQNHEKYQRALDFCAVIQHAENIQFYIKGITQHKNMQTFQSSYNLLTTIQGYEDLLVSSGSLSNLLMIISLGNTIQSKHRIQTLSLLQNIVQGNLDQQAFSFEIRKIDFLKIFLQELSARDINYEVFDCLIDIFSEMLEFQFFPLMEHFQIVNQNIQQLVENSLIFVRENFSNSKYAQLCPRLIQILFLCIEKVNRKIIQQIMLDQHLHFELVHLLREFVDEVESQFQGRMTLILAYSVAILTNFVDESAAFVVTLSSPFQRIKNCAVLVSSLDPRISRELNIPNLFACCWHICSRIIMNQQLGQFKSTFVDAGMLDQLKSVFLNYDSIVFLNAFEIFKELINSQYQIKREVFSILLNEFIVSTTARFRQQLENLVRLQERNQINNKMSNSKQENQSLDSDISPLMASVDLKIPIISIMQFFRSLIQNNPFTILVFQKGNILDLIELIFEDELSNIQALQGGVNQALLIEIFYILLNLLDEADFKKLLILKQVPMQLVQLTQILFQPITNQEIDNVMIEILPGLFESQIMKTYWEQNLNGLQYIRNLYLHYSDLITYGVLAEPYTTCLNLITKSKILKDQLLNSNLSINRLLDYLYMHFINATAEFKTMILEILQQIIFLRTDIVLIITKENKNSMKVILFGISSENRLISILSCQILYEIFKIIEPADFLNLADLPVTESLRKMVINTNQSDEEQLQLIQDMRTIYQIQFGKIFMEEQL